MIVIYDPIVVKEVIEENGSEEEEVVIDGEGLLFCENWNVEYVIMDVNEFLEQAEAKCMEYWCVLRDSERRR